MSYVVLTSENFHQEVILSDKPVLVDFWASWCGPCQALAPTIDEIADEQPGIKNLINIYCACTGKAPDEVVREFDGKGYAEFKPAVGEAVVAVLKPLQDRVAELSKDKDYIDSVIKNNAEKAQYFANKTLRKVQKKIGFPERIR